MLSDVITDIGNAAALVGIAILLIATYRAFGIGRALMRGVYRNRAYWIGATAVDLVFLNVAGVFLPSSNSLSALPFFVTFVVLFAFVDTSIAVARETDFFHGSVLGWERVRKPFAALLLVESTIGLVALSVFGASFFANSAVGLLAVLQLFFVAAVILAWGAVALTKGARKSADATLKRFTRMLGLTVVCLVLFFTVWIPFGAFSLTIQDLGSTISIFFATAGAYFLYLAVMSLSPVGRVEEEVNSADFGGGASKQAGPLALRIALSDEKDAPGGI